MTLLPHTFKEHMTPKRKKISECHAQHLPLKTRPTPKPLLETVR